jgi:hypothetical protein
VVGRCNAMLAVAPAKCDWVPGSLLRADDDRAFGSRRHRHIDVHLAARSSREVLDGEPSERLSVASEGCPPSEKTDLHVVLIVGRRREGLGHITWHRTASRQEWGEDTAESLDAYVLNQLTSTDRTTAMLDLDAYRRTTTADSPKKGEGRDEKGATGHHRRTALTILPFSGERTTERSEGGVRPLQRPVGRRLASQPSSTTKPPCGDHLSYQDFKST